MQARETKATDLSLPPMSGHEFSFAGERLHALSSGALWWGRALALVVSDLHLGKSNRVSRRGGPMLPPYETRDTLARLEQEIERTGAEHVICLGDSFDDAQSATELTEEEQLWLNRLQAGRKWTWIEGNHDPGPMRLGGSHMGTLEMAPFVLRHIAMPGAMPGAQGEISGHYHPKFSLRARGMTITRPCFVHDDQRLVLPAFGTYTGGMSCLAPEYRALFSESAHAIVTGPKPRSFPLQPRGAMARHKARP